MLTRPCPLLQVGLLPASVVQATQVRTKYGDWRTIKDQGKRHCVRDFGIQRVRLNAIRKNKILPPELRVSRAMRRRRNTLGSDI